MLKFFRKIRQKLLSENKIRKPASPAGRYLIYAIGEILLVVIGILIALQINNANQSKNDRSFELKMLRDVRNDLVNDINYVKNISGWIKCSEFAGQMLINSNDANIDSLFATYSDFLMNGNNISLETRKGAYNALINSGFEKISNDTLRSSLVRLYDFEQVNVEKSIDRNRIKKAHVIDLLFEELVNSEIRNNQNGDQSLETVFKKHSKAKYTNLLRLIDLIQEKNESNLDWIIGLIAANHFILDLLNNELSGSFPPVIIGSNAIQSVGILGSATKAGWEKDIDMEDKDQNGIYTLVTNLSDGEVKFRANDSWTINWGTYYPKMSYPIGVGFQDSPNIKLKKGEYRISLDINNGFYRFEKLD